MSGWLSGDGDKLIAEASFRVLNRIGSADRDSTAPPESRATCVQGLVRALREEFQAKVAFLAWQEGSGNSWVVCSPWPGENAAFAGTILERASVQAKLTELAGDDLRHSVSVEPGDNDPFEDLVAVRLPMIDDRSTGVGVLCLIDRLVRNPPPSYTYASDEAPIQQLVSCWAERIAHRRDQLREVCEQVATSDRTGDKLAQLDKKLQALVRSVGRMLSPADLVRAVETLTLIGTAGKSAASAPTDDQKLRADNVELLIRSLRPCGLPRGAPDCAACDKSKDLPEPPAIVQWAQWREVAPEELSQERDGSLVKSQELLKSAVETAKSMVRPKENLSPRGLHCFVLGQASKKWVKKRMRYWTSAAPSHAEVAAALGNMAHVVHHALDGLRIDDRTIQALVWVLCEYAHKALGVPAQLDLRAHLLQAARNEPALLALKRFYRDHFFHALEVCFLGHFFLELQIAEDRPLWEFVADALRIHGRKRKRRRRVLQLWYTAALLHDVGYSVDLFKGVCGQLSLLGDTPELKGFLKHVTGDLGQLSQDLAARLSLYDAADKPGEDHGVLGAWHIEHLLEGAAKSDAKLHPARFGPAIRAIALHNSRKHTVRFKKDPLAFLLILCDTLQEWNRPRLSYASAPLRILSSLAGRPEHEGQWSSPLRTVRVNAELDEAGKRFCLPGDELRCTLEFDEEVEGNAGVFNLWLDASCNLQRLNFAGLPDDFDIAVEYRTPLFMARPGAVAEQQFYRLREAARETHMTFLERWFPDEPGKAPLSVTNRRVTWRPGAPGSNNSDGLESLTLHLRQLCKNPPITADVGTFHRHLEKWKRVNEDREFGGDYAAPASVPQDS